MAHELNQLYAILLEQDRIDDLKHAVTDTNYQQQLMSEYGIGAEEEDENHSYLHLFVLLKQHFPINFEYKQSRNPKQFYPPYISYKHPLISIHSIIHLNMCYGHNPLIKHKCYFSTKAPYFLSP